MNPILGNAILLVAGVGVWCGVSGLARLLTRPARPSPGPETAELGDEPPAVVALLVNGWQVTPDAVQATLLDLAARGLVELRQPGDDPGLTTVAVTGRGDTLTPYEERVLHRVRGAAGAVPVPMAALSFPHARAARAWQARLRAEILVDARRRGLSRPRFGPLIVALLAVLGLAIGGATAAYAASIGSAQAVVVDLVLGVLLALWALRPAGERDTPAGRAAAERWLGIREWLRGQPALVYLPPAAAQHWGRHLAYGTALGVARLAGSVLDLGLGSRSLVWSRRGGSWHRIRVRYPRFWSHYGRTPWDLAQRALAWVLVGGGLLSLSKRLPLLLVAGVVVTAVGLYRLVRVARDRTVELTGEVLWLAPYRGDALSYVVIDHAGGDETVAWLLPSAFRRCAVGDTVAVTARPWSRRIVTLRVTRPSTLMVDPSTMVDVDELMAAELGAGPAHGLLHRALSRSQREASSGSLLAADEVTRALGLAVRGPVNQDEAGVVVGFAARGQWALLVRAYAGMPGRLAWRLTPKGTAVPGVGDEAYAGVRQGIVKAGDAVVVLTLAEGREWPVLALPTLLAAVTKRLAVKR